MGPGGKSPGTLYLEKKQNAVSRVHTSERQKPEPTLVSCFLPQDARKELADTSVKSLILQLNKSLLFTQPQTLYYSNENQTHMPENTTFRVYPNNPG